MPSRFTVPAIGILEPARDLGQQRSCLIAVKNESKPNLVPIVRGSHCSFKTDGARFSLFHRLETTSKSPESSFRTWNIYKSLELKSVSLFIKLIQVVVIGLSKFFQILRDLQCTAKQLQAICNINQSEYSGNHGNHYCFGPSKRFIRGRII